MYSFSLDPTPYRDGVGCGRYLNHSYLRPNIRPKVLKYKDANGKLYPRVIFVATKYIPAGTELRWNYGDLNPALLEEPSMRWMLKC